MTSIKCPFCSMCNLWFDRLVCVDFEILVGLMVCFGNSVGMRVCIMI